MFPIWFSIKLNQLIIIVKKTIQKLFKGSNNLMFNHKFSRLRELSKIESARCFKIYIELTETNLNPKQFWKFVQQNILIYHQVCSIMKLMLTIVCL